MEEVCILWDFQGDSVVKNLLANAGVTRYMGSFPGCGRSLGGGNGNPLQRSCLENSMDRGPDGLQSMGSQRSSVGQCYLGLEKRVTSLGCLIQKIFIPNRCYPSFMPGRTLK